jgi:ectoine hydroxylase-related dioxygenase (phytanoyl-CoA dioxygenase family)
VNPTPTTNRAATLANYDRDGYAIFRGVIDADLVRETSDHIAWLLEKNPERTPELLTQDLITDDPFWVRLISDDRLLDIAELFVGPNIGLFASHYLVKPPFTGKEVRWHQDAAFWPLEPMEVVTLWLAIDESTPENGCVKLVPGSHKNEIKDMHPTDMTDVLGSEISVDVDERDAVNMVLQPGDVEVHHPMMYHGSTANRSPKRRAGLTIRYIPTSTRITSPDLVKQSAFWLRGDRGVNEWLPSPVYREGAHFAFRDSAAWS